MVIYKHTSKSTGKSYIGLTTKTMEERLKGHITQAEHNPQNGFHKLLREKGPEEFESTVIDGGYETLEELKSAEILWIKYYDTFFNGYNETPGGDGGWTEKAHAKGVETRKRNGSYIEGAKKRLESIGDDIQKIVDKTAATRRERGDFDKLSERVKEHGIGYEHTCPHCGKTAKGGNYSRWHGDNCKQNPDITEEALKSRESKNKGKTLSEEHKKSLSESRRGIVTAYDKVKQINVKITKEEFESNPNLVGMGAKGTPSYKKRKVSQETRDKISKIHKGKAVSKETRKKLSEARRNRK